MDTIRTESLTKEEKDLLTALLAKLRILPQQGQVILHCHNGRVAKVEPHVVIACRGEGGREKAEQKLQFSAKGTDCRRQGKGGPVQKLGSQP